MEKIIEFRCVPEKLVYNSTDFKIYGVSVNSFEYPEVKIGKYNTATIKGNISELNLGIDYIVKAKEVSDSHGVGYDVINIKRERPTTLAATRTFLYEILTQKQTDVLLEVYPDIVDRIMNNRLDDIDLSKTKGIKDYTFNVIKNKVIENFKLAEIVEEFRGLFNLPTVKKLYEKYTSVERIKEVIREEPYQCLCRLGGIGFKTADSLLLTLDKNNKECKKTGEKPVLFFGFDLLTSYQRAKACVDYLLNENENNGNTYMHVGDLKKQFDVLVPEAKSNLPLILKGDNDIIFDRELLSVCKKETYETEKYIAERINEALHIHTKWDCDYSKFQKLDGFTLTEEQCKTSKYMCENNLVLLVGYGGSGKSSSTQAFVNMLNAYNKKHLLLAPTGRAAKVLSGFTNENAMTIHRGLMYMPPNNWQYNEENKLPYDVIIVDEFSMVDIFLFRKLLEAIDFEKTKLLLIGDDAQIPSVGAGNVLYDLLKYKNIPTITLDKVFRYGKGGLSTIATDTRTSTEYLDKTKTGMQVFGEDRSYIFMPIMQDKLVEYTVKLYQTLLSKGYSIDDIAILSCYNVGDYGTVALNKKIQDAVNHDPKAKITFGDTEFRLNDIVMNYANDYKAIIYDEEYIDEKNTTFIANGESGRVIKILKDAMVVDYDGILIYVPKSSMKNIRLSYAISVHKCIPENTILFSDNGLIDIGELDNNAQVYESKHLDNEVSIYNGEYLEKPTNFYNAGVCDCKKIVTKRGYSITATLDHKIDVLDKDGFIVTKTIEEITKDDYILINKKNNIYSKNNIMPNISLDFIWQLDVRAETYKIPQTMNEDFALLLGMIVADGCVANDEKKVNYGKNQKEVVECFSNLVNKIFGYKSNIKHILKDGVMGGMYLLEINSSFINKYLRQIDGLRPHEKFVPECILKSSKKIQTAFLKGLFEDGTVNVKKGRFDHIEFSTCEHKLALQIQMMLLNMGMITTLRKNKNSYYIYLYKNDAKLFYYNIGFISNSKCKNLEKCLIDTTYSTNYTIPYIINRIKAQTRQDMSKYTSREKAVIYRNGNCSTKTLLSISKKTNLDDTTINDINYLCEDVYVDSIDKITDVDKQKCVCLEMPETHKFIQNGFVGSNCQGGQYKVVILLTPRSHTFMLNSNLLYVGISRAKERCYHLGEIRTVNLSLKKKENFDRKTMLQTFLKGDQL